MTPEELLQAAWFEAHQELRVFLEHWTFVDKARAVATATCALWVRHAMDGRQFHTGPYGGLYAACYETAKLTVGGIDLPSHADAEKLIPLDKTLLPYQLSKIYVDCWKAAQLLHWDRRHVNRVTRGLSIVWPTSSTGWSPIGPYELGPMIRPLARRAVETLHHHDCLDCDICTEAAVRWEGADRATEEWFTDRRLRQEGASCPTQEKSPSE